MTVHMIWAEAKDRVIGAAGSLPWNLPEDLALFRRRTLGQTVVMGRSTWESLPSAVRPLPGRRNVVLTRTPHALAGVTTLGSVEESLAHFDDMWVIGGASLYEAFLPHSTHIVRTRILLDAVGDTHAPPLSDEWTPMEGCAASLLGWRRSVNGLMFTVDEMTRHEQSAQAPRDKVVA